ncbi:hypothetical protein Dtox_2684 [Desulfofarcimen acetoxidans DSM 771]|uniref:Uncharacterized protein n=1 Tax=Desulfofarcimen acetoxidans (strain ATCC 49208 / DSM 771 / KCTC 5769 / VKM B-1644 / 5575) TaxID=485916 RepID=C8W169_DESAS|nr:hypothetical protein [Desulfofarcimen acetoxidans]ACV63465.1 hypothetical protein Dtox_2684 [Desulfofarcimen acetoxidans DSM 771]
MEIYLENTQDKDLCNLIKWGLDEIVFPSTTKLEQFLKNEGLTIPPRPTNRLNQLIPGQVSKIRASDDEVISAFVLAIEAAVNVHVRGLVVSLVIVRQYLNRVGY